MASLGGKDLDLEKSWQRHVRKDGKALHLAQQALVKVPAKVFTLPGLVELDLSRNCLETLPRQIQVLSALQVLNLSWNSLCQLPNEICSLKALKTLALDFNKLTCLPDEIGKLSKLRKIQANDNKITHIPESISQLRELSELSLQYNSLQVLPNSLCLAGSRSEGGRGSSVMRVFNLRGNPLLHPPMDVVVEGTDAILRYLRAQYSGGQSSSSQERPGETKASTSTRVTSSKVEAEVDEAFDSVYTEYKFTELHREVQELIEKVSVVPAESLGTSASGPGGSATQASPSRLKREIPTSVRSSPQRTLSPIAASAKGKQPLSPAKLYTGRTLFANKSSPAQRSRMDDLHECMTSSSTPTVTSQNAPVQSPDGRQGRFVRSLFAEQQTSNTLQGLSLEGCLTVNGGKPAPKDEESEQRRGGQQAEGNSRDAPTIEPKASSVAALRTPTTEPVDEEYLDIVQNLLRERNPALADTFEREIVNTISDEDEESSEDDSPVQSLPEVPASQKSPDISKLPKAFLCPITHDIMKDPVVLSDGHTYERSAIEKWIKILGRRTSPMTGLPLPHIDLTPNFTLKSMIVESCK